MLHTTADQFGKHYFAQLFLLRRIIRIAPLYWVMTLAVVVVGQARPGAVSASLDSMGDLIASLLFIPYARDTGEILPVLPLGWTLNYEMFFYSVFAGCLLARFEVGIVALFVGFSSLVVSDWLWPFESVIGRFLANSIIVEFLFGIAIALLVRSSWRPSQRLVMIAAGCAVLASVAAICNVIPTGPRVLTFGIPAALTVFVAVFLSEPIPSLTLSLFVGLGEASYSLYLTHMFSIRLLRGLWFRLSEFDVSDWYFVVTALIWASAIGCLVHRFFEVPVTRWFNGLLAVQILPKPLT